MKTEMANVVVFTPPREMTTEEWAQLAVERMISISDEAPPAIRDQARAFRENIHALILHYMRQAIFSDRAALSHKLRGCGHDDLAMLVIEH